jgi:hypothetical protein
VERWEIEPPALRPIKPPSCCCREHPLSAKNSHWIPLSRGSGWNGVVAFAGTPGT